jgi:hypothetical protein
MPWWLLLYFFIAFGVAIAALLDREDANLRSDLIEFGATCTVLVCACAYWLPAVFAVLGHVLPWLVAAGTAALLLSSAQDARKHFPGQHPAVILVVIVLWAAAYGPAIFWAFAAAMGRSHNGA